MSTVLMVIHIIIVITLILTILVQKSEGGTLGASSSSMGGLMTTRGAANFLTRLTAILTTLFFISSIGLAIYFKGHHMRKTILSDDPIAVTDVNNTSQPVVPVTAPQLSAPLGN